MIGKVMVGKGFAGCISYCLEDKKIKNRGSHDEPKVKNRAEILQHNLCYGDKKNLCSQFSDVRKLNPKQSRPVMHITLSLAPGRKTGKPDPLSPFQIDPLKSDFKNLPIDALKKRLKIRQRTVVL